MSAENDLALAYHMGYDDALAKRKPDASKTEVLASGDLAAENANLRDELDAAKHDLSLFSERIVELGAENAKLRELVKRMRDHIKATCGECDGWYCSNFDEDNECCVYDTLARELGIEVDE